MSKRSYVSSDRKVEYQRFGVADIACYEHSDAKALVTNPLVSIYMLTYNHEFHIAKAIEGVLQQDTDYPYELVIGEDCSTDGTRKIVLAYQKEYSHVIRVLTSDNNIGAHANSWRVHCACRGKYLSFCDGDDYWHQPKKLQKQINYLEAHPDVGLVHSSVDGISTDGHTTGIKRKNSNTIRSTLDNQDNLFTEMMLGRYQLSTVTVCVRKDLVMAIKRSDPAVYLSNRFFLGDLAMWLDLSHRTRFHFFNEALASYRILQESASHSRDPEKVKAYQLSAIDLRLYYLDKYPVDDSVRDQILRYLSKRLLRSGFALNDVEMVDKGKKLSGAKGIEDFVLYIAVINRYLRIVFFPLQCLANRRWFRCGFMRSAS